MAEPMVPLGEENFAVDAAKRARPGLVSYPLAVRIVINLKRAEMVSELRARPLLDLNLDAADNCLSESPQRAAKYQLAGSQREAIKSALADRAKLSEPLAIGEQVVRHMGR